MSQGCQEKNSRKMHFFRKQEPTNFAYFSAKNEKRYLTTVCVIIIMKKLHRGVAQMVARMVRDHEAASSSLATPTIMWRQKRCLLRKARIDRAFLLPKRRFFSVPKHRCKIAVFPLWIDLNSRKVNIRYTGR